MWQRLERKISFLCLFVYFFLPSPFFVFFILPFLLSAFFSIRIIVSAFSHPHLPSAAIWSAFYRHPLKTRHIYFIYPLPCRLKLGKSSEIGCVNLFRLSWHFIWEKPVFLESIFIAKQELPVITRTSFVYKTSRPVRTSLLISALNNEFCFFSGKLFYKNNIKLFSCICIAWYKHSRGYQAMQTRKTFSIA